MMNTRMRRSPIQRAARRAEAEQAALLRNCRTVFGAAAILILAFGVVYRLALPEAIDPWSTRILLAAISGTLLFATSYVAWLRRHCTEIAAGLLCGLTAWFIILTAVNEFDAAYGLGLVFTIAAIGFALLMTQDGVRPVLFYAAASTLTPIILVLVLQPPMATAWLAIGSVAGIGVIIVLSSKLRTHLMAGIEASEKRFRKLSEAAFEAIFITDEDVIVDCNTNALVLLGHTSRDRILGCSLSDFMPRAERTAREANVPAKPYRHESTMLRGDGTLVAVEIRGRPASDDKYNLHVVAVRDITEQKEIEQKLIESRRRVEETLEIRNSILTNVSHEFRTPLAVMLGYAEMLKEQKFNDAGELGELIYESGRQLNDTLNLILELAQIEGGGYALSQESVNVAALADDVVRSHRQRASLKHLDLDFKAKGSGHYAEIDSVRVLKIIDYLVDNAIKFTNEGTISVSVESSDGWTSISVEDTGIGIEDDFLPQIFTPFRQESAGLTRSHGGLGVGLTIARHMTESMGGRLTVESEKGKGSRFTASFPSTAAKKPGNRPGRDSRGGSLEIEGSASAAWM